MPAPARSVVAVAVAALLLAGCSSTEPAQALDPEVVNLQPGEPGEPNQVVTEAPPEEVFAESAYSDADAGFMRDMQVHHQQALTMTAMVDDRTDHEDLRLFVQRMEASQEGELDQLERMLADHDEAVRRSGGEAHDGEDHEGEGEGTHGAGGDHAEMPGMLSDEALAELEAAEGDEFARLFLVAMSQHHEGALTMVGDFLATDGVAAEPRLFEFAEHVDSDQRIEIDRMARMYAELPAA